MFYVVALVCNLTGTYPGMSDGCTVFTSTNSYPTEEICEEYLLSTGVVDLYNLLISNGETKPELRSGACVPAGEVL